MLRGYEKKIVNPILAVHVYFEETDMKRRCPSCKEKIDVLAEKCPFCMSEIAIAPQKKNSRLAAAFYIIAAIGFFIWLGFGEADKMAAKNVVKKTQVSGDARAVKGESIYKRLQGTYAMGDPQLFALKTDAAKMLIWVPEVEWNKMSKEDKVALTYYAQSLVQDAHKDPSKYNVFSIKSPEYLTLNEKIQNLCDDCWGVGIGSLAEINKVLMDKIVVQGDTPWLADDKCCRGVKGSEFRR